MKRLFVFLLSMLLILSAFTGCSSTSEVAPTEEATLPTTLATQPPQTTEGLDLEAVQRQLFYDYLKQTHIPEVGLADMTPLTWTFSGKPGGVDDGPANLVSCGRGGLISAVVRDFDLDGTQDMVTFYINSAPYSETWDGIYNSSYSTYRISMSLYVLDGGNVVLSDTYRCLNLLDGRSWGYMYISMEQLEDGIYLDSFSYAEDYSTYGASPRTIFHVSEGKFVFDYIAGIGYGQGSMSENPNHVMNTTNIHPLDYTFGSTTVTPQQLDPNGDTRENRWIYYAEFNNNDWYTGSMEYKPFDFTGLRIILDKGLDAYPHAPLPQGGKKPENPTKLEALAVAQPLADYVADKTGCTFINTTSSVYETNNTATIRFETETYSFLTVTYDGNTKAISAVSASNNKYPVPQEWYNMKDAVLQYPDFALPADEINKFLGSSINYNLYTNGVEITGATVHIMQISDTSLRVYFH